MPSPTNAPQRRASHATKEERDRDAAQAVRDYAAEKQAVDARTARLRAQRLAKEAGEALPKKPKRPRAGDH